jgi:uncharacterized membrane protein
MGGGSSKTTSNISIVNNSIIEAVIQAAQNCSSNTSANQQINHSGLGLFSGATQNVSISLSCLQKVVVNDNLIATMAQKIIQNVSANNGELFFGSASANANTSVQNYLKTKITTQFIQNCVSNVAATQRINYGGVQIGVFDNQSVTAFQNCMMNALNSNSVAQGITTDTNQTGTATNPGFSLDLGLGSFGSIGMIIIVIIIAAIGYSVYSGHSAESSAPQEPPSSTAVSTSA